MPRAYCFICTRLIQEDVLTDAMSLFLREEIEKRDGVVVIKEGCPSCQKLMEEFIAMIQLVHDSMPPTYGMPIPFAARTGITFWVTNDELRKCAGSKPELEKYVTDAIEQRWAFVDTATYELLGWRRDGSTPYDCSSAGD